MIITGGFNVCAVEVEAALNAHPAVAMSAVVGVPHAEWGEAVQAEVVPTLAPAEPQEGLADRPARLGIDVQLFPCGLCRVEKALELVAAACRGNPPPGTASGQRIKGR